MDITTTPPTKPEITAHFQKAGLVFGSWGSVEPGSDTLHSRESRGCAEAKLPAALTVIFECGFGPLVGEPYNDGLVHCSLFFSHGFVPTGPAAHQSDA
jgi:hypothetical protein